MVRVESTHTFRDAHVVSPNIQKHISYQDVIIIVPSSWWCYECHRWWYGVVSIGLPFLPFFTRPPPRPRPKKTYSLAFLVVNILTLIIIFYLCFFIDVLFVFNFIFQSQFAKYFILQYGPHSLNFYFFFLTFCKSFSIFQFNPSISNWWYYIFQFGPCYFDFKFFSWPFSKSYYSFQFLSLITTFFLFFMSILILVLFNFLLSFYENFLNFTIQLYI